MEIALRPVEQADVAIFYEHQLDPEGAELAAFPSREHDAHFAHWERIMADENCEIRTITADGVVVGNIGSWIEGDHREIGYWIGKRYWGQGIATQGLKLFLDEVDERPMYAWVAQHNKGSLRVLEKCGFVPAADQPPPDERGIEYVVMELDG